MAIDTSSRSSTVASLLRELRAARKAKVKSNIFGYVFIAPAMILYFVFNIWPMLRGFIMAFTDYRFIYPKTQWAFSGLANFKEMASDAVFWSSLGVSVRYTLMVTPATIVVALILAVLISRVRHLAGLYRWIVYLPVILPIAVTLLMFGQFFGDKFGFINSNLRAMGVARPPYWLGDVRTALGSVAIADIWRGFGFPTLLFLIGIYGINAELYEAASIDGATVFQQFWGITVPMLRPTFLLILVLSSGIVGATEQMMILTNGGPQNVTRTIGLYFYQVAFTFGDLRMGYAASMSLVLGLVGATLTAFWFRVLRER
jgi:multiple sugar transport system permease protein